MKKQYVPKTLTEFLSESNSIPLKRKYGERPAITAGTNAPLRNQVLSFVAESGSVSKTELKQFILGLKEGGATVAAANMFIKRNSKYFMAESKNGVTYFKLSNLGQRLVNQFVPMENTNVSESVKSARSKFSSLLESARKNKDIEDDDDEEEVEDIDESEDFDAPEEMDDMNDEDVDDMDVEEMDNEDMEAADIDDEGPAEEIDYEEDEEMEEEPSGESDQFEYEEDDEKIVVTFWKNGSGANEDIDDMPEDDMSDEDMPEDDMLDDEDLEDDEDFDDRPEDEEPREFDFKDKGRPGLLGMDEAMSAQFVSHKLTGKKKSKFAGRYGKEYHNLLDDNEDKNENELKDILVKSKKTGKLDEQESRIEKMKQIIENLRSKRNDTVFEAEESTDDDELKDEDLDSLDLGDEETAEEAPEETPEETPEEGVEEVEKVEITEFIITVDDVDAAIDQLQELGVTAERVPVEAPVEDVPAPEEEPAEEPMEEPAEKGEVKDLNPEPESEVNAEAQKESFRKFVQGIINEEEEEEQSPDELGTSDELGLGDQGEEAKELEEPSDEENVEPTTEFEENKIKVKAEDWDTLRGWLEEKGVDVAEMFGGEIETEEFDSEEAAETEAMPSEVSDEEIDFTGIGDDDKTKVEDKEEEEEKE